jgi:hypothetical protein
MIVFVALAVTAGVLAVDLRTAPTRRRWFRLQAPAFLAAIPATLAVALMTHATGSLGPLAPWLLAAAPLAAAAAFVIALSRRDGS